MANPSPTHPDPPRIVIAGFGLVTPLGYAAWDTFAALLRGQTLGQRAAHHDPPNPAAPDPVALVRQTGCVGIAQHEPTDPAVVIAERAAREAGFMAGAELAGMPTFLGTSKGAVVGLADAATRLADGRDIPAERALTLALGPQGYLTHELQKRLGIQPRGHHVAACASSLIALHQARQWLLESKVESPNPKVGKHPTGHQPSSISHRGLPGASGGALVLTAEAALLPALIHSYRRLGVLADLTPGGYRQRPLDRRRAGFMLSELGAALVLRRLPAGTSPKPGEIELLGTAVATEAHDMIRPAPGMPALRHVADELLVDHPMGMIHPHAPGTPDHDPEELAVYRDILSNRPDLYAVKGAVGHGLGAAGLVSLVLACLCLKAGQRPPMPWLDEPMEAGGWSLDRAARPVDRTLAHGVFAAGFGGHTAGAVVKMA